MKCWTRFWVRKAKTHRRPQEEGGSFKSVLLSRRGNQRWKLLHRHLLAVRFKARCRLGKPDQPVQIRPGNAKAARRKRLVAVGFANGLRGQPDLEIVNRGFEVRTSLRAAGCRCRPYCFSACSVANRALEWRLRSKRVKFPSGVRAGCGRTLGVWVASGGRWKRSGRS